MCCNQSLNNEIDRLHEQCLQIVYRDRTSNFSELHEKDGSVFIHYKNIWQFAIEMLKVSKGLCPEIMKQLFQFRNKIPYNLKQRSQFDIPHCTYIKCNERTRISLRIQKSNRVVETHILPCRLCKPYFYRIVFL